MFTRALGIKIATAVLATSLAVGGVVAGAHNAAPSFPASAPGATRTAQIEGEATAVTGPASQPASTVAPSQAPTAEPPAQPVPTATATRPQRPLSWLLPFLRPNPPRTAVNPSNVGGAGGAAGPPAPKTAVTGHSVGGLVLSVTGNKILLRRQNGSGDAQVIVRPGTVIREQGKDVPMGDVHPGDRIVVIGVPQRDGSLAAQAMVVYPRARPAAKSTPRTKPQGQ